MQTLPLPLPDDMLAALRRYARGDRLPVEALIREAVTRDLVRRHRKARKVHPDERSLAPLRALLADDFAYARGWHDLLSRLAAKGYGLREAGAGLILVDGSGAKIAKASDLGYAYGRLRRRFGTPFPAPGDVASRPARD
ncbi:MAG: hypothetical protein ACU0CO_13405 [Shimia sp.]